MVAVASASLNNLIPQRANWPGFFTKPIRVPVELVDKVKDMVKLWVGEILAAKSPEDISVQVGEDAPDTEQEWANAMMGLPADYKVGDPFPPAFQAQIDEIVAKQAVPENQPATVADSQAKDWASEPEPFTQDWIDFMQALPSPNNWNWPDYLSALHQEAQEGHESAQAELEAFKANGVAVGGGLTASSSTGGGFGGGVTRSPNYQRREERKAKRQAKHLAKKADRAALVTSQDSGRPASSGAVVRFSQSDDDGIERVFNLPGVRVTANPQVIAEAKQSRYEDVMTLFQAEVDHAMGGIERLFDQLETEGKRGKLRRFEVPFNALKKWVVEDAPTIEEFYSREYMERYKIYHKNCKVDFITQFYATEEQQKQTNTDGMFYRICTYLFDALYRAIWDVDCRGDEHCGFIPFDQLLM